MLVEASQLPKKADAVNRPGHKKKRTPQPRPEVYVKRDTSKAEE